MDNNNNNFYTNSDEIGIDPTTVPIVDTLDDGTPSPEEDPVSYKKRRAKEILKKILFSVGVLVLMAGVAFGLYFYLHLGSKKNKEHEAKFELEDRTIYVGDKVSDSIFDYGEFENVDVSHCTLDVSGVDPTFPGNYEYSMTCDEQTYTAKITVLAKNDFDIKTHIVYKTVGDMINASEFVTAPEDYKINILTEDIEDYLSGEDGIDSPYKITLSVENENGNQTEVTTLLYVFDSNPANQLNCTSENIKEDYYSYTITNRFLFDTFLFNLDAPVRIYEVKYTEEATYAEALGLIDQNGIISLDDLEGYGLRDDENLTLTIVKILTQEMLDAEEGEEFPTSRSEIQDYYQEIGYTCQQ